jgi:prophage DNA circulation protein
MSQPSDVATSIQALAATLLATIADPADAVRIFTDLCAFPYTPVADANSAVVQAGIADLCRRTACVALAQATALYQPTSQNDAQTVLLAVSTILDDEITIAGDQGQDETFFALTSLKNAVSQDLTTRGAALPPLQTFTTNVPMPALVLAYQYYDDITRTDQLIASASPAHPAFMPLVFQALSS